MAQVQRIDLLQNNFACATAKFPATYPVFLSGNAHALLTGRHGRRAGGHGAGARRGTARERRRRRVSATGAVRFLYAVRRADGVGRALLRKLWGGQVGTTNLTRRRLDPVRQPGVAERGGQVGDKLI